MVREAGGFVTEIDGRHNRSHTPDLLAANDALHAELVKLLRVGRKSVIEPRRTA